ncbi:uncharacterized protein At5g19025-like, partial [Pyrus x bretschneideri]|uniref:uncharacterized protein At5g19025-like n=1 Tax=Pyrus x bretschneideri TaxID=225117 RepID=UPI00202EB07F
KKNLPLKKKKTPFKTTPNPDPTHTNISPPNPPHHSLPLPLPRHPHPLLIQPPNPNCTLLYKNSLSATLDLLILILVLFSGTFLITFYFSYIFNSISLISHSTLHLHHIPVPYIVAVFAATLFVVEFCCVSEGNLDYECLRIELRRMGLMNGHVVLLFQLRYRRAWWPSSKA